MNVIELSVATRVFRLPNGTDLEILQRAIHDAVQRGGALIDIPAFGGTRVSALVTPATPVFVDHIDVDDETPAEADAAWLEMEHFSDSWLA